MRHARFRLGEFPLRLKMRKAYSMDVTELETHLPDARAANCALVLLGRELNLFTEKKVLGQPGGFDQMAEKELIEFIEAQDEVMREHGHHATPPVPKPRKGATKHWENAAPAWSVPHPQVLS